MKVGRSVEEDGVGGMDDEVEEDDDDDDDVEVEVDDDDEVEVDEVDVDVVVDEVDDEVDDVVVDDDDDATGLGRSLRRIHAPPQRWWRMQVGRPESDSHSQ